MAYSPFTRAQIKDVIDGKGSFDRIPMTYHFWCSPNVFGLNKDKAEEILNMYPCDIETVPVKIPLVFDAPENDSQYKWIASDKKQKAHTSLDDVVAIEDWDELEEILANFPNPNYVDLLPTYTADGGKYRLARWWYFFFERLWSLRGMQNALMDFYLYPDEIKRLFSAICDFYCRILERIKEEGHCDGVFTSDDIGTQTGPFFSRKIFCEFFKPYYKRVVDRAHELGLHFWLHACGNIKMFISDLIDIGVDVLHPIQKYTMDEREIADTFGQKICIWAGFDVQQTIPYGTPDDVRREVRYLIDTYANPNGRFILTLGNAATSDTKIESLEALLNETVEYGHKKMCCLLENSQSENI